MSKFVILSDSCCDLPKELIAELNVGIAPLSVQYDENTTFPDGAMDHKQFYDGIRSGKMPKTAAVNPEQWGELMESALKEGSDVLALCFAYGLSTTYQSAVIAATELSERYPGRKILVVDTACASVGHGLVVWYAARMRNQGQDIDTVHQWVLDNAPCVHHWVTVNDLMHLKRGGRVSATTALVGTMLQIKPILNVTSEGKLDTVAKARGRKAAMGILLEKLEQLGTPGANDTVILGHGDCPEEAEAMAQTLKERYGVKNVIISYVGNVIGSHTGPDVLVLTFLGQKR